MLHSGISFASFYLIFLCLPGVLPNLESQMLKSLQTATRCKGSRTPPKEPVLAFSPKRYAQLVAALRTRTNAPSCGGLGSGSFDINEPKTWSFCTLGNCIKEKCNCISSYTGSNCAEFGGKCWLMYCFLNSCKKSFQNLHCKCDPSYYGMKVLSGDYWYDEGKKESYVAPPKDWTDSLKGDEGAKISAVVEDIKFPSFDNAPSSSDKDQTLPSKSSEEKSGNKGSSSDKGKNEGKANQESEEAAHSDDNDVEESSEDQPEDAEEESEESSACLFAPISTMWTIILSVIIVSANWP